MFNRTFQWGPFYASANHASSHDRERHTTDTANCSHSIHSIVVNLLSSKGLLGNRPSTRLTFLGLFVLLLFKKEGNDKTTPAFRSMCKESEIRKAYAIHEKNIWNGKQLRFCHRRHIKCRQGSLPFCANSNNTDRTAIWVGYTSLSDVVYFRSIPRLKANWKSQPIARCKRCVQIMFNFLCACDCSG